MGRDVGGRDRLITYEPGRLSWFDPESATEQELIEATSNFDSPRTNEIPHVDVTRDVNGDGRDDLVVPAEDGFQVFVQLGDGAFAEPVTIGPPTDMSRIYGADGYRYDPWSQSRVHEVDYDREGAALLERPERGRRRRPGGGLAGGRAPSTGRCSSGM